MPRGDPLYKPLTGRIVIKLSDPDVTRRMMRVPLSRTSLIVERCDVLADVDNVGDIRIGCENIEAESTEVRGEELQPGIRMTLPRTDLAWWYVMGDTADDLVTWSAEQEVDRDGRPVNA